LESFVEVGNGFLTVLPLNAADFYLFVNLGHLNPPGHTFPSDHGGFYLTNWEVQVPVFSPGDMTISRITRVEHVNKGYFDYDMTLSVNNGGFELVFGHLSALHASIETQVTNWDDENSETYTTGGDTYTRTTAWTDISVLAGDTLAYAGGNPGQFGVDFGAFDQSVTIDFASDRFDGYKFPHTVSPLDYFTEEIRNILIPMCGDYVNGVPTIRTVPPIGGTVDFDLPGTLRGLWFRDGEPTSPEDPHLALIYCNVIPDVPLFCTGVSIPNLNTGLYTFTPVDVGETNRLFEDADTIGQMYIYEIRTRGKADGVIDAILLVQLIDATRIRIERQEIADGPPWVFTAQAIDFIR